jgi:hypothetical protein
MQQIVRQQDDAVQNESADHAEQDQNQDKYDIPLPGAEERREIKARKRRVSEGTD